jgi:hypothetical protein
MPANAGSAVDNFHAGGIAAGIDLGSGMLGPASNLGLFGGSVGWLDRHPLTGGSIEKRVLPHWEETLELVRGVHSVFSQFILVGWDMAILADSPVVIEGNRGPDTDLMQRPLRAPIGTGRLAEMLEFHLDRAERKLPPPVANPDPVGRKLGALSPFDPR